MQYIKPNLAIAVREARTELGPSQEKLAEILNLDQRTILNIGAWRGNPKFEKLYPLITYLKVRYLLDLMRKQDHPTLGENQ